MRVRPRLCRLDREEASERAGKVSLGARGPGVRRNSARETSSEAKPWEEGGARWRERGRPEFDGKFLGLGEEFPSATDEEGIIGHGVGGAGDLQRLLVGDVLLGLGVVDSVVGIPAEGVALSGAGTTLSQKSFSDGEFASAVNRIETGKSYSVRSNFRP